MIYLDLLVYALLVYVVIALLIWLIGKRLVKPSDYLFLKTAAVLASLAIVNIISIMIIQEYRGNGDGLLMLVLSILIIIFKNKIVTLCTLMIQASCVLILLLFSDYTSYMAADFLMRIVSIYFLLQGLGELDIQTGNK